MKVPELFLALLPTKMNMLALTAGLERISFCWFFQAVATYKMHMVLIHRHQQWIIQLQNLLAALKCLFSGNRPSFSIICVYDLNIVTFKRDFVFTLLVKEISNCHQTWVLRNIIEHFQELALFYS